MNQIDKWIPIISGFGGVILGWLLSYIGKKGKVYISIDKFSAHFYGFDSYGDLKAVRNEKEINHYRVDIILYIYNDSAYNKTIRNFKFALINNKKNIICEDSLYRNFNEKGKRTIIKGENIGVINIPPKSGLELEVYSIIDNNNLWCLKDTPKEFIYYSIKNKDYSIFIRNLEYKKYINFE